MILVVFQEICTLALAAEINGDRMNPLNFLGLVVCLSGIGLHVVLKAMSGKYNLNHLSECFDFEFDPWTLRMVLTSVVAGYITGASSPTWLKQKSA
jgi:hypothetical protein